MITKVFSESYKNLGIYDIIKIDSLVFNETEYKFLAVIEDDILRISLDLSELKEPVTIDLLMINYVNLSNKESDFAVALQGEINLLNGINLINISGINIKPLCVLNQDSDIKFLEDKPIGSSLWINDSDFVSNESYSKYRQDQRGSSQNEDRWTISINKFGLKIY